ncbi:MAG: hypothetical protein JWP82_1786 [Humibacillus sp.]|nr:hypothetical protein [Humibacillus sp.]
MGDGARGIASRQHAAIVAAREEVEALNVAD